MRRLGLVLALMLSGCTLDNFFHGALVLDAASGASGGAGSMGDNGVRPSLSPTTRVGETRYCVMTDGSRYFTVAETCGTGHRQVTQQEYESLP